MPPSDRLNPPSHGACPTVFSGAGAGFRPGWLYGLWFEDVEFSGFGALKVRLGRGLGDSGFRFSLASYVTRVGILHADVAIRFRDASFLTLCM